MPALVAKKYPDLALPQEPRLSALEKRLLDQYQHGFPLSATPYADIARELGTSEALVLEILTKLQDKGYISRIGPVFKPKKLGASTLVAMAVPRERLREVASIISHYDEVNHNYEREHEFNLWFVVTARDEAHLQAVLEEMQARTGCAVLDLPLQRQFHIDLGFPLWC